ncbi:MAG: hypothetical protein B6240_00320 [Desulfobacteraceae bacterium 4572_87]|nr:MAG: hypothetical protein B6240_00320 [Desulfobacteraceae bacterium 4572_87]
MKSRDKLKRLESHQEKAPDDFVVRVMAALPEKPHLAWADRLKSFWPKRRFWPIPALAGALAMFLFVAGLTLFRSPEKSGLIPVVLDLYAPSANQVQLVGTFSNWMPGVFCLKGPDALGYWVIDIKLPPGRYEYTFLVNGSRLVPDDDGDALRADGFGHENSVLLLNDGLREFDQPCTFTLSEYATMSHSLPEQARSIMDPLFQNDPSNIVSKHVFLKLQEGILEKVRPDILKSAVHNRHAAFKKARTLLAETNYGASIETNPTLLNATAFALESGFDPSSIKDVLTAGKGKTSGQISAVIELGETLDYVGMAPETLLLIMKDCLLKNLAPRQIERVMEHVTEKLRKGDNHKAIRDELWV